MVFCKQFIVNDSFPGFPQLSTTRVPTQLLGCLLGNERGKLLSNLSAKAASKLLIYEPVVIEESVFMQKSCSEISCLFSKDNMGVANVDCPALSQEDHHCYVPCSMDCIDVQNGRTWSSEYCEPSDVFLCNPAEMSNLNSNKFEDQNGATVKLVQEKHSCDESEISESSLCDNQSNCCGDIITLADLATFNSKTCFHYEDPTKNISEKCEVPFKELIMTSNPNGTHVMENDITSDSALSVVKYSEVVVEGKDILNGREIGIRNQILPCEEKNVCSTNAELLSHGSLVDDNSKGAQLSESGSVSDPHVLCAFNSISVIDFSAETDSDGKDNGGFDCASEVKCSGVICPSQRSARINESSPKSQEIQLLRKCRKSIKGKNLEIVDMASKRKRSSFFRPARSSSWGLLVHIARVFEQHNGLDVNRVKSKKSRLPRVSNRGEKWKKNLPFGISQRSIERSCPSPCRIRLKLKLGKGLDHNCLEVIVPKDDVLPPILPSYDMPEAETQRKTKAEFLETGRVVEQNELKNYSKEKTNINASAMVDKDQRSSVIMDNVTATGNGSYCGISSQLEVETSPDSEVINTTPDVQVTSKIEEDFYDGTQTSTGLVANGDVIGSNLVIYKGKRGKKLDNFAHKAKHILDEKNQGSLCKNKIRLSLKRGVGFSSEMFDSSASKNASDITSINRKFPKEFSPSLNTEFVVCQGESNKEAGLESCLDSWIGSSKIQNHDELISSTKNKGNRSSKASKSKFCTNNNCISITSDLARNVGEVAWIQRGSSRKSGKNNKVEDMGNTDHVLCSLDEHLDTGTHQSHDLGNTHSPMDVASENSPNLETSILEKQFCLPRSAWVSCDECHKWRCIPATLADTIEETKCKWTCKDNMEKAFADCSIPQEKSNEEINAELQISDASGEEDAYNNTLLISKGIKNKHLNVDQKSSWTLLKSNLFLHRGRKKQIIDEIMVCQCVPPTNGLMGCGNGCLNRILNIECVRGTCPCGNLCSNQQFQKRKYAKMESVRCGKKGYGLQSLENIRLGKFLIEYVGEVLDLPTYEARQRDYASRGHKHFYFMTLDGSEVIDASAKGNLGRFINHSCDPNCRTEKWMVNGEVCIGLFAVREIKQGEEVTFDYNYVRVFGAAAKKCVCGSPQCRGYIGGDLLKSEVIIQSDSDEEFPEPVMVCKNAEENDAGHCFLQTFSPHDGLEMKSSDILLKSKDEMDVDSMGDRKSTIDVSESITSETMFCDREKIDKHENASGVNILNAKIGTDIVAPDVELKSAKMEISLGELALAGQVQPLDVSQQIEDANNIPKEKASLDDTLKKSPLSIQICDNTSSLSISVSKRSLPPGSIESKFDALDGKHLSKSGIHMKTNRPSSSNRKEKSNKVGKPRIVAVSDTKGKTFVSGSTHVHLESVEEKLNQLLDTFGGISKRKESPRGYLKLLLLTAASGDRGSGEAIQSTRDLSMILDALLKTKSRSVLVDIITQNGLQMLHNIMKKYQMDFNKTPVLRKLLKVLEFLGVRQILTPEHITRGPPCPGMESFWESIIKLTKHVDKEVSQCARIFRDEWAMRYRRYMCPSRENNRNQQQHQKKVPNRNRISTSSHNSWPDQNTKRPSGPIMKPPRKPLPAPAPSIPHNNTHEKCSTDTRLPCKRKRKSRWSEPLGMSSQDQNHVDHGSDNRRYSHWPFEVAMGTPQPRFRSHLPVAYGIPLITVQQFGRPVLGVSGNDRWVFAPSMPFQPFPPLPPLPRNTL